MDELGGVMFSGLHLIFRLGKGFGAVLAGGGALLDDRRFQMMM